MALLREGLTIDDIVLAHLSGQQPPGSCGFRVRYRLLSKHAFGASVTVHRLGPTLIQVTSSQDEPVTMIRVLDPRGPLPPGLG